MKKGILYPIEVGNEHDLWCCIGSRFISLYSQHVIIFHVCKAWKLIFPSSKLQSNILFSFQGKRPKRFNSSGSTTIIQQWEIHGIWVGVSGILGPQRTRKSSLNNPGSELSESFYYSLRFLRLSVYPDTKGTWNRGNHREHHNTKQ